MAQGFNLTAQLNLVGPSNVKQIAAQIKKDLGTVNANINFKLDPTATKNVTALNSALKQLNSTLGNTNTSATSAANAIKNLGKSINSVKASNLSQQLNTAAKATNNLNKSNTAIKSSIASVNNEMQEFGKQAGLAVRRFSAFATVTSVIYGLTNSVSRGVQAFIDYDKELVRLQQVTGQSLKGLSSLQSTITNLSTSLGVGSKDLTTVAVTLAQAGLSAKDTEKSLRALALSSLAPSFDSMNETVEGSIALMRQFGIGAVDLEKALGSVNAVAAKFAVEASDIITAIQRTGGVFATASRGVSEGTDALNEFIAVFTSVRATTRESAETVATGLRTIFTRIQRGDTIDALKEFGVNLQDAEGRFVGAYKAVELLSKGLNSIDPRELKFSKIVEELGGFRQIGKVIPLIQQFATAQQALAIAQQGQGSLAEDAATGQKSLSNQISKVREQFFALFRELGQSQGFQTLAKGALTLASAFIKILDATKSLLPALSVVLAFKGSKALTEFVGGLGTGFRRGPDNKAGGGQNKPFARGGTVRKFARGGVVPGAGSGDTVPAMLEPGEFVIRKKAVETIGSDNLHNMNKYGGGGSIRSGRSGKTIKFGKGGKAAKLASIDGDFTAVDGDTFDATVTPTGDQFTARFRVAEFDTYEGRGKASLVSADKAKKIKSLNKGQPPLEESSGRYKVPKNYKVTKEKTAAGAAETATKKLQSQLDKFVGPEAASKTIPGGGGVGRYLAKTGFSMPDSLTTGRKWDEDGNELNIGGIVKKFMAGGKATEAPFGTGETKFPKRISNLYEREMRDKVLKAKSDEIFGGGMFDIPKDERINIDENKASEEFSKSFDRQKFMESFKSKIMRNSLYGSLANFAKFIGLPSEDLSKVLPQSIDFGGEGMRMGMLGAFFKDPFGSRGYDNLDLSSYGFSAADEQDLYGYQKLLQEKDKEVKKIMKTPVEKFDDGSFRYDEAAFKKAYDEKAAIQSQISKVMDKQANARKAAMEARKQTAESTGRGVVGIGGDLGGRIPAKNDTLYHELTHQLFKSLKLKQADSFTKYKDRVDQLFNSDNDALSDAFDALPGGSYSSADVVYGRYYKNAYLGQALRNNRSESIKAGRELNPDLSGDGYLTLNKSEGIKKAREYKPINPQINKLLLAGGIKQESIDKAEDSGKEEFLTTLIQTGPNLDSNMQGILDSTLNELLGNAGIQRQQYADGGSIKKMMAGGAAKLEEEIFKTSPTPMLKSVLALIEKNPRSKNYYFGEYQKRLTDSLNLAYKGVLMPGTNPSKEPITPDTVVSAFDEYGNSGYINTTVKALEDDLKYITGGDTGKKSLKKRGGVEVGDMLDTIRSYQSLGFDSVLNSALSNNRTNETLAEYMGEDLTETYKTSGLGDIKLDQLVKNMTAAAQHKFPETLYSGLGDSKLNEILNQTGINENSSSQDLIGKTFNIPSFLSASEMENAAVSFARVGMLKIKTNPKKRGIIPEASKETTIDRSSAGNRKDRIIQTLADKGSKGFMGLQVGDNYADAYDTEGEHIFPPNSKFKVLSVDSKRSKLFKKEEKDYRNVDMTVQQLAQGGKVTRNLGYIDFDVINDPANAEVVEQGMKNVGVDGPRNYTEYLTDLAIKARKDQSLKSLKALYGVAGAGKSSIATGRGSNDTGTLRQTNRFPILTPEDITKASEVMLLTSTVSQDKLEGMLQEVDRAYTLSSTTKEEKDRVLKQRTMRDVSGVGLFGRSAGSTTGAALDTAKEEALLEDRLGSKSVVLGRKEDGGLRRKRGSELVQATKKKIGLTWGGFAPTTAGHESMMEAAKAAGIPYEDFIALVGSDEAVDAENYRTAVFDKDFRLALAKAGFGSKGASVLPKAFGDMSVPLAFDMGEKDGRRQVTLAGEGSMAFVADKTEKEMEKYKKAGYGVSNLQRTGGISGTQVRDLLLNGNLDGLQQVVSPSVFSLLKDNMVQLQNRSNVLPTLIEQAEAAYKEEVSVIDQQLLATGITRANNKKAETDPEYAAQLELYQSLKDKKKKLQTKKSFEPYRLLRQLAASDPAKYGLRFDTDSVGSASTAVPSSAIQQAILAKVATETAVKKSSGILPAQGTEILKRFGDERLPNDPSFGPFSGKTVADTADGGKLKYWQTSLPPATNPEKQAYYFATRDYLIQKFKQSQGTQKATALKDTTNAVLSSTQLGLVGLNPLGYTGLLGPETWNLGVDSSGQDRSINASIVQRGLPNQYQNVIDYLSGQTEEIVGGASKLLGISPKKLSKKQRETLGQGNIEGALLEQIFGSADATILDDALRTRPIDFPMGIGPKAASIFGIDPDIPTEVKRTIDSGSRGKAVKEFQRYFREKYGIPDPEKEAVKLAGGGPVKLYHGSNTGVDDNVLKSFKEKGALSDIAKGYGQGAGFYLYTEKNKAEQQAKMRVNGGSNFTVAQGDRSGKPMVLTFNEQLSSKDYDLDYELQKGLVVQWMHDNYDALKDKYAPTENQTGLKGKFDKNPDAGMMSVGVRVQEGSQTLKSEDGTEFTLPGGSRKSIYAGSEGDVREGALLGQLMSRIQSGDSELVNSFESKLFEKPLGLALKYVGSSPLKPSNIETFAKGGQAGISSQDTVPALLTPGEFVINKKAAQNIGYGKLNQLNKADKIKGYNKGGIVGGVQKLALGGLVDPAAILKNLGDWVTASSNEKQVKKFDTRPSVISKGTVAIPKEATSELEALVKNVNDLGFSAAESASLIKRLRNTSEVSYQELEDSLSKDIENLKSLGAGFDTIIQAETTLAKIRAKGKEQIELKQNLEGAFSQRGSSSKSLMGGDLKIGDIGAGSAASQNAIEKQAEYLIEKKVAKLTAAGKEVDLGKITDEAYKKSASQVSGVKESAFTSYGISGKDIKNYIDESKKNAKTLKELDKALLDQKLEALKNDATYRTASKSEQARMEKDLRTETRREISVRRSLINDLAKRTGSKGVGAIDMMDFNNSPILKALKSITFPGALMGAAGIAGVAAGQGNLIGKIAYSGQDDASQINAAKTSAAIESSGTILSTGLATAAQIMETIPGKVGLIAAAVVAAGTVMYSAYEWLTDASGSQREAGLQIQKELVAIRAEEAQRGLEMASSNLDKAPNNIELINAFNDALNNINTINATSAVIDVTNAQIDFEKNSGVNQDILNAGRENVEPGFLGMNWLYDSLGRAMSQYLPEWTGLGAQNEVFGAPEQARVNAQIASQNQGASNAALRTITQGMMAQNVSREEVLTGDQFKAQRTAVMMGDTKGVALFNTMMKEAVSAAGRELTPAEIIEVQNRATEAYMANGSAALDATIKTNEVAKAMEAADRAGRRLATSLNRMIDAIDQSISRIQSESQERAKASKQMIKSVLGEGGPAGYANNARNIIDNPLAYSDAEYKGAMKQAGNIVGGDQGRNLTGLIGVGANLSDTMYSGITNKLRGKASLTKEEAAKEAINTGKNYINNLDVSDEVKKILIDKLTANVNQISDNMGDAAFANNPQQAVDQFADAVRNSSSALGDNLEARARETAKTLLALKDNALNDFAQSLQESSEYLRQATRLRMKADKIAYDASNDIREIFTGVGESYTESRDSMMREVGSLTGGVTDPAQIGAMIEKEAENNRKLNKGLQGAKNAGDDVASKDFIKNIQDSNDRLKNYNDALEQLADSTEVYQKALDEARNVAKTQSDRKGFIEKLLTNTPEEADKLNQSLIRLQRNLSGGLNNATNQRDARKAFNETYFKTGNLREAGRAGNSVLANQRKETLGLQQDAGFRAMRTANIQNQSVMSGRGLIPQEQIEGMFRKEEAQLMRQMAMESGFANNPAVMQAINVAENPNSEPMAQASAQQILEAAGLRKAATEEQARVRETAALIANTVATDELRVAIISLTQVMQQAFAKNADVEAGKVPGPLGNNVPVPVAIPAPVQPRGNAKGGMIFASAGQYIDFKPKGADRIPAMLSDGEFVINARSTSKHLPLLKAINDDKLDNNNAMYASRGGIAYLADGGMVGPKERSEQAFSGLDKNQDGILKREELQNSMFNFNQLDTNRNNMVEMPEFISGTTDLFGRIRDSAVTPGEANMNLEARARGVSLSQVGYERQQRYLNKYKADVKARKIEELRRAGQLWTPFGRIGLSKEERQEEFERRRLFQKGKAGRNAEEEKRFMELMRKKRKGNPLVPNVIKPQAAKPAQVPPAAPVAPGAEIALPIDAMVLDAEPDAKDGITPQQEAQNEARAARWQEFLRGLEQGKPKQKQQEFNPWTDVLPPREREGAARAFDLGFGLVPPPPQQAAKNEAQVRAAEAPQPPQQAAKNEAQVRAAEAPAERSKPGNELLPPPNINLAPDLTPRFPEVKPPEPANKNNKILVPSDPKNPFSRPIWADPTQPKPAEPEFKLDPGLQFAPDGMGNVGGGGNFVNTPNGQRRIIPIPQQAQAEEDALRTRTQTQIESMTMQDVYNKGKQLVAGQMVETPEGMKRVPPPMLNPEQQAAKDKRDARQKELNDRRDALKTREKVIREYYGDYGKSGSTDPEVQAREADSKARADRAIEEAKQWDKVTKDGQTGNNPAYDSSKKELYPDLPDENGKLKPQQPKHWGSRTFKDVAGEQGIGGRMTRAEQNVVGEDGLTWNQPNLADPREVIARVEAQRITGEDYAEGKKKSGTILEFRDGKPVLFPHGDKAEGYKPPQDLESPYGDAKGEDLDRLLEKRAEDRLNAEIKAIEKEITTNKKSNTPEKQQQLDELKAAQRDLRFNRVLGSTKQDLTVNQDTLLAPSVTEGGPYIDLLDTATGSAPGQQPSRAYTPQEIQDIAAGEKGVFGSGSGKTLLPKENQNDALAGRIAASVMIPGLGAIEGIGGFLDTAKDAAKGEASLKQLGISALFAALGLMGGKYMGRQLTSGTKTADKMAAADRAARAASKASKVNTPSAEPDAKELLEGLGIEGGEVFPGAAPVEPLPFIPRKALEKAAERAADSQFAQSTKGGIFSPKSVLGAADYVFGDQGRLLKDVAKLPGIAGAKLSSLSEQASGSARKFITDTLKKNSTRTTKTSKKIPKKTPVAYDPLKVNAQDAASKVDDFGNPIDSAAETSRALDDKLANIDLDMPTSGSPVKPKITAAQYQEIQDLINQGVPESLAKSGVLGKGTKPVVAGAPAAKPVTALTPKPFNSKDYPIMDRIMNGGLKGDGSNEAGSYYGSMGTTNMLQKENAYRVSGWKTRLIPKSDESALKIKEFLDSNPDVGHYKLAHNSGDMPVFSVYFKKGSKDEAMRFATASEAKLKDQLDLRLYQGDDTLLEGTGISARFDARALDATRASQIIDSQLEGSPFAKSFAKAVENEKLSMAGKLSPSDPRSLVSVRASMTMPNNTAGTRGIPDTGYVNYLKTRRDVITDPVKKAAFDKEIDRATEVADLWLQKNMGDIYSASPGSVKSPLSPPTKPVNIPTTPQVSKVEAKVLEQLGETGASASKPLQWSWPSFGSSQESLQGAKGTFLSGSSADDLDTFLAGIPEIQRLPASEIRSLLLGQKGLKLESLDDINFTIAALGESSTVKIEKSLLDKATGTEFSGKFKGIKDDPRGVISLSADKLPALAKLGMVPGRRTNLAEIEDLVRSAFLEPEELANLQETILHETLHARSRILGTIDEAGLLTPEVMAKLNEKNTILATGSGNRLKANRLSGSPIEKVAARAEEEAAVAKAMDKAPEQNPSYRNEKTKLKTAQTKSRGGLIYANNGAFIDAKPKGKDTNIAMLADGEFVVNDEAAKKNLPVLQAINDGHFNRGGIVSYLANGGIVGPKYYATGGNVRRREDENLALAQQMISTNSQNQLAINSLANTPSVAPIIKANDNIRQSQQTGSSTGGVSTNGIDQVQSIINEFTSSFGGQIKEQIGQIQAMYENAGTFMENMNTTTSTLVEGLNSSSNNLQRYSDSISSISIPKTVTFQGNVTSNHVFNGMEAANNVIKTLGPTMANNTEAQMSKAFSNINRGIGNLDTGAFGPVSPKNIMGNKTNNGKIG